MSESFDDKLHNLANELSKTSKGLAISRSLSYMLWLWNTGEGQMASLEEPELYELYQVQAIEILKITRRLWVVDGVCYRYSSLNIDPLHATEE